MKKGSAKKNAVAPVNCGEVIINKNKVNNRQSRGTALRTDCVHIEDTSIKTHRRRQAKEKSGSARKQFGVLAELLGKSFSLLSPIHILAGEKSETMKLAKIGST